MTTTKGRIVTNGGGGSVRRAGFVGTAIAPTDKVGNTFQLMEFTDGLNECFFGTQYRWPHERWTPYVGFGVGPSVPHVEVRRPGVGQPYTFEYQLAGVDVEGLVGIEYRFGPHVSAFADYKLSFAINDTDLKGGGSLDTDIWTNHIIFGLSYRFGASAECGLSAASAPLLGARAASNGVHNPAANAHIGISGSG